MADSEIEQPSTREQILAEAIRCFADKGFEGTSLNDIAAGVGIRRPSLLHHFPSKEALYREAFEHLLGDWFERLATAVAVPETGERKMELVISAGFDLFADNPDYVRLMRREALDGGAHLGIDLAAAMRPMFDKAAAFFDREMAAGTFRRQDAKHLLLTGYGAVLSYFSEAPFMSGLLDADPLAPEQIDRARRHVIDLFIAALKP